MRKLLSITLIRDEATIDMFDQDLVKSELLVTFTVNNQFRMYNIKVIENRNYLFPVGVYKLQYEYSPKFKKKLWEFKDIPQRSEIKFHQGSKSSHSKGCPLLTVQDLARLNLVLKDMKEAFIHVKLV